LWVFGGRDEDNKKLNDLWKFDLAANTWQEIKPSDGNYPLARSGHAADVYEGQYMVVFGGIYEITKELNDLHMFDFSKRKWITVFEESNSPKRKDTSPTFDEPFGQTTHSNNNTAGSPVTNKKYSMMSPNTKAIKGRLINNHSSLKKALPVGVSRQQASLLQSSAKKTSGMQL
jgi:N-acetylneuraminic acid mutarotase